MVSIDTLVSISRKDLSLCETLRRYFSANRYERPIADSRGAVHPRVVECCEERAAMENELSRIVNGAAAALLIEKWIYG
jgi:hypothetical protein